MEHNLNFTDIVIRYILMMFIMIAAGVFQSIGLVILGVLVFMTAISAYCPLFHLLGKKPLNQN